MTSNASPLQIAAAKGPFIPILRAYLPREELISQRYAPPAIEKL